MKHTPISVSRKVALELRECPACGAFVALTPEQWERRQEGRDGGGYTCPNGHTYGWWESPEALERKRAESAEAQARRLAADMDGLLATVMEQRRALEAQRKTEARVRRRANAGVCQDCHRSFQNVVRHRATKHPAPGPEPGAAGGAAA